MIHKNEYASFCPPNHKGEKGRVHVLNLPSVHPSVRSLCHDCFMLKAEPCDPVYDTCQEGGLFLEGITFRIIQHYYCVGGHWSYPYTGPDKFQMWHWKYESLNRLEEFEFATCFNLPTCLDLMLMWQVKFA